MKFAIALLLQVSIFGNLAWAHAGHGAAGTEHLLGHIVENGILLKSTRAPSQNTVRLADGSSYALDSDVQKSVERLIDLTQDDDLAVVRKTWAERFTQLNWPEAKAAVLNFPSSSVDSIVDTGRDLSFTGSRLFARHGLLTAALVLAAEIVEHVGGSLITAGASNAIPLCTLVQAGCVAMSQPIKEYFWTVRERFPQNQNLRERLRVQTKTYHSRFEFWKTMRRVFLSEGQKIATIKRDYKGFFTKKTAIEKLVMPTIFWSRLIRSKERDVNAVMDCGHVHAFGYNCVPLARTGSRFQAEMVEDADEAMVFLNAADNNLNRLQRVTAAGEQIAYLKVILSLVEQSTAAAELKYKTGMAMNTVLGKLEAAYDEYAIQLRQIAEAPSDTAENNERITTFIKNFYAVIRDIHAHLKRSESGDIKVSPNLLATIQEMRDFGRRFGRTGSCASALGAI